MSDHIVPITRDAGAHSEDGFVYALELSDGRVKVGMTMSPQDRIPSLMSELRRHGLAIAREWYSAIHRNPRSTERLLIAEASKRGTPAGGREYFSGLSFDEIVEFASSLDLSKSTGAEIEEFDKGTERLIAMVAASRFDQEAHEVPNALESLVVEFFFKQNYALLDMVDKEVMCTFNRYLDLCEVPGKGDTPIDVMERLLLAVTELAAHRAFRRFREGQMEAAA